MTELEQLREENARLKSRLREADEAIEEIKATCEMVQKRMNRGPNPIMQAFDSAIEALKAAPNPWDTEIERPYDASLKPTTTLGILMAAGAVKVPENPVMLDSSRNPDGCGGGK